MAYYSKYTGAELEERLDKVEEIPQLIAQMITGKDFVTKEDLLCVLKDYAPATYATIPIDNNTIYWENGVLKAATSDGGGQCQWELREHKGVQYLFSRLPVVTQYDVTMYADVNHLDLPSIYDGLPIDGDTIYWEETEDGKVLKAKSVGGSGENIDAGWVISVISNAGFATQNWVNSQNFISSSLLYTELAKYVKIKDYQEIEGVKNFLNGLQIAGLPITKLNGYEDVIYIDANVVVRGGLTMYYEDGEIDLPSIKDEIGNAGYDGVTGLASFDSSQFSISSDGTVTIIGGSAGLDTAQLAEYLTTNKYATQGWITEQNYASASNLTALQSKVDNFLEGSDSDTIINKWLELEAFLSGLSESDNLATILSNKANKSTTLAGYGITDAYTKTQVDNTFKLYIPIAGYTEITGEKNFIGGLRVNNSPVIYYDEDNKYWKLEGDLLVTGGVSMYSDDTDFIPSTIMDAVVVDGVTIKKRSEDGALYFAGTMDGGVTDFWELNNIPTWIGSSKPTYTLGSLQNVDSSSIDATATVDRVLFQQAGSSTWSWKALSEIGGGSSGGSVSGNYLPLSGGTLTGTLNTQFIRPSVDASYQCGTSSLRWDNVYSVYGNFSNSITINGGTVWHSGNDGAGSGLDADLLDGLEATAFFQSKGIFWSTYINSVFNNGAFYTSGFTPVSGAYKYGTLLNFRADERLTQFYITDGAQAKGIGARFFFRDQWNAQESITSRWLEIITSENIENQTVSKANQLTTARTIWGQSFDGSGNVSGDIYLKKGFGILDDAGIYWIVGIDSDTHGTVILGRPNSPTLLRGTSLSIGEHIYLTGVDSSSSVQSTSQLIFGTSSSTKVAVSAVQGMLVINPSSSSTDGQSVLGVNGNDTYFTSSGKFIVGGSSGYGGHKFSLYGSMYTQNGIATGGNIIPVANRNVSLGRWDSQWKRIYVSDNPASTTASGLTFCDSSGKGLGTVGNSSGDLGIYAKSDIYLRPSCTSAADGEVHSSGLGVVISSSGLTCSGGITMYSDQRKKTILNNVELTLQQIANAPLIQHYYNSDQDKTTHVGSIAQYWASMNDWFCKLDAEGYYTMEIQNCALASAISIARHLEKYESKTDKTIRKMKQRITELEEEVERLKQN